MTDLAELMTSADPARAPREPSTDDAERIYQLVRTSRESTPHRRQLRPRSRTTRWPRRTVAAVFCALVVAGAVVLAVDLGGSRGQPLPAGPSDHLAPLADVAATPAGWVAVPFEEAQISVPASWSVEVHGSTDCLGGVSAEGTVFLGEKATPLPSSCAPDVATVTLTAAGHTGVPHARETVVNGIPTISGWTSGPSGRTYLERALGVDVAAWGEFAQEELATLTHSPLSVVLSSWSSTRPAGWRTVEFGGLRVTVPPSWRLTSRVDLNPCGPAVIPDQLTLQSVPQNVALPAGCLSVSGAQADEADADGLRIASGAFVPSEITSVGSCHEQRDLRICMTQDAVMPYAGFSALEAVVYLPGKRQPDLIALGLAGSGLTALEVFDSLQPSAG